jgi:hypothetical protein
VKRISRLESSAWHASIVERAAVDARVASASAGNSGGREGFLCPPFADSFVAGLRGAFFRAFLARAFFPEVTRGGCPLLAVALAAA